MGNNQLIKGAGDSAKKFVDIRKSYNETGGQDTKYSMQRLQDQVYEERQNEIEMKNFVNSMQEIDVAKVEESMRPEVNDFLIKSRNEYAEAARLATKLDAGDPNYIKAVATMNRVNGSFQNLSKQLDSFKTKRTQFMTDTKNNSISAASDKALLDSIYKNNDFDIIIGPNGDFTLAVDNEYVPFSDFDKDTKYNYHLKNFVFGDQIMALTEKANTFANPIIGDDGAYARFNYQLSSFFRNMDDEDLASVLEDDIIGNGVPLIMTESYKEFDAMLGGLGLAPENRSQLLAWTQNYYMQGLNATSLSAKKAKERSYNQQLQAKKNISNAGKIVLDPNDPNYMKNLALLMQKSQATIVPTPPPEPPTIVVDETYAEDEVEEVG